MFNYLLFSFEDDYKLIGKKIYQLNKTYLVLKNNFKEEIKVIQENLNNSFDIFNLIDEQHLIIKKLLNLYENIQKELTFRKLIIERKECILKDLNTKILNNFILKCYNQEIEIEQLKQKILNMRKLVEKKLDFNNVNQSSPLNIIVPKSENEFNGTIAFFTKPTENNIIKFQKYFNSKQTKVAYNSLRNSNDKKKINKKSYSAKNVLSNKYNNDNYLCYSARSRFNEENNSIFHKKFSNTLEIDKKKFNEKGISRYTKDLMNYSYNTIKKYENKSKNYGAFSARENRHKRK